MGLTGGKVKCHRDPKVNNYGDTLVTVTLYFTPKLQTNSMIQSIFSIVSLDGDTQ
jgi:hypothetical protein